MQNTIVKCVGLHDHHVTVYISAMAFVLNTNGIISNLPDNILLEIFNNLTVKELCCAGRCVISWWLCV